MGYFCNTSCGDLDNLPSRSNMTLWDIIVLVIIVVIIIIFFIDLVKIIQNIKQHHMILEIIEILKIVEYIIIVIGLVMITHGLFCSPALGPVKLEFVASMLVLL